MHFDARDGRFTLTRTATGYRITDTVAARPEAAYFALTVSPHYDVSTKVEAELAVTEYLSSGRWGLPDWYRKRELGTIAAHMPYDGGQLEVRRNVSRRKAVSLHREQLKAMAAAERLQARIRDLIAKANEKPLPRGKRGPAAGRPRIRKSGSKLS